MTFSSRCSVFASGTANLFDVLTGSTPGVGLIGGLAYECTGALAKLPKRLRAPNRSPGIGIDRPQYRREDWAFLWVLLIIGGTGYRLLGRRLASASTPGCLGYALVVARRRTDRRGVAHTWLERTWRRAAAARSLVVPWNPRPRLHRADSLHQGKAYLHRGRILDGARSASLAAAASHTGESRIARCRQDH